MNHPSNNPPTKNSRVFATVRGVTWFPPTTPQEHEEALLEECDAQLEAAATPAATGEDGAEQEFFGGEGFLFSGDLGGKTDLIRSG